MEPYADEACYVGFSVGDQEIGLDPNGHSQGMTEPIGYWHVGGDKFIASVKDADDNIIGLIQPY